MNNSTADTQITTIEQVIRTVEDGFGIIQRTFNGYQQTHFPSRTPEFFCLELCGEAGELANLEKKQWKGQSIPDESLADEAADVLIALINYTNARGINLAVAASNKLRRIEDRRLALATEGKPY